MTTPQQEAVTAALIKAGFDDEPGDHPLMSETAIEALREGAEERVWATTETVVRKIYPYEVAAIIEAILGPKAAS